MKYKPFKEQLAKFIKEGCKDSQFEEIRKGENND